MCSGDALAAWLSAIANAIYKATGVRVLPITLDEAMGAVRA